jgi:hypothetical protein
MQNKLRKITLLPFLYFWVLFSGYVNVTDWLLSSDIGTLFSYSSSELK